MATSSFHITGSSAYGIARLRISLGIRWDRACCTQALRLHLARHGQMPVFLTVASLALWLQGDGAWALRRSTRFTPAA